MSVPTPEAQVAQELAAIAARIAALGSGPPNTHLIGAELVEIKAHLRRLAESNAEVKARSAVRSTCNLCRTRPSADDEAHSPIWGRPNGPVAPTLGLR